MPVERVYIQVCGEGDGARLHAQARAGDATRAFTTRLAGSGLTAKIRDLVAFIGEGTPVAYDAAALQALLSVPRLITTTRAVLGRLHDLRDVALIAVPHAGEYSLEAVAACLGLAYPADEGKLPALLCALEQALGQRLGRLSAPVQAILRDVLGDVFVHADIPWADVPRGDTPPLTKLGRILPHRPRSVKREPQSLSEPLEQLAETILSPEGAVAAHHPSYEHRTGQVQMASAVARSLRDSEFLLVEAGTGVGKSLAYLVPAIIYAREAAEAVVVSTNTKNLQQQLLESDLPLLRQALPIPFEAALLKGRGNYACVRTLVAILSETRGSLFGAERLAAAHLFSWLAQSATGDMDELSGDAPNLLGPLAMMTTRVRSDGYACLGKACSYNEVCPVEVARAHARNADIVVVNHALLLAETRTQVLPDYSRLVLDEAQNLETVATDCLGLEVSRFLVHSLRRAISGETASLVESLRRRLPDLEGRVGVELVDAMLEQVAPLADEAFDRLEDWGEELCAFCFGVSRPGRGTDRVSLRLTATVRASSAWQALATDSREALRAGLELQVAIKSLAEAIGDAETAGVQSAEGMAAEVEAASQRVAELLSTLENIVLAQGEGEEFVSWVEAWEGRYGSDWSLRAAPVDIGAVLHEELYQHKDSIIFTSATLSVDDGFSFFRQRAGLNAFADKLIELQVPSSFNLPEQLLLCVPGDFPLPDEAGYTEATISAVGEIIQVARGGTLVLFTSRVRMNEAFRALRRQVEDSGLTLLAQDTSGSRWGLIERMKADDGVVVFGLKSFWEGVDVPGSALRCVVITKLPFAVPDDPIIEARQEHVRSLGFDPVRDYYIPDAILGFKQGLGRLIRSTTDHGVVFVLDRRILVRGYGRRFFRSIPRSAFSRQDLAKCLEQADEWLRRGGGG
jgi:ATP-dependent DNA helicase DinG